MTPIGRLVTYCVLNHTCQLLRKSQVLLQCRQNGGLQRKASECRSCAEQRSAAQGSLCIFHPNILAHSAHDTNCASRDSNTRPVEHNLPAAVNQGEGYSMNSRDVT